MPAPGGDGRPSLAQKLDCVAVFEDTENRLSGGVERLENHRKHLPAQISHNGHIESINRETRPEVSAQQGERGHGALHLPASGDPAGKIDVVGNNQCGRLLHVPNPFLFIIRSCTTSSCRVARRLPGPTRGCSKRQTPEHRRPGRQIFPWASPPKPLVQCFLLTLPHSPAWQTPARRPRRPSPVPTQQARTWRTRPARPSQPQGERMRRVLPHPPPHCPDPEADLRKHP